MIIKFIYPLLAALVVLAAGVPADAQFVQSVGATQPTQPAPKGPKVVNLTVAPAAEIQPALKYRFDYDLTQIKKGNAALLYYQAVVSMPKVDEKIDWTKVSDWRFLPANEMPMKEVETIVATYKSSFRLVELAGMRDGCDWGLATEEGVATPLPSLQQFRQLARMLALKAKLEIAQGKPEQAFNSIRTCLLMGQNVGKGPYLLPPLVGIAIVSLANDVIEMDMLADPHMNLYWALAGIPRPVVNLGASMQHEGTWIFTEFPKLKEAMEGKLSPAQFTAEWQNLLQKIHEWGDTREVNPIAQTLDMTRLYTLGKKYLLEHGRTQQEIDSMPLGQVVVIYIVDEYVALRDDQFKALVLPYWQAQPLLHKADHAMANFPARINPLVNMLPTAMRAYFLQTRVERQLNALQTIEAIRAYAAGHDGNPPASLDDLKDMPAPIDPVTGKPFVYKADGKSFVIECLTPGEETDPQDSVRYEVTIKPAAPATMPAK